ncbi:DNA replication complex subunit Gins51 [Natrinema salifodinae]|uniref:DNA replication factor GINS n=1 Tax=Natrinema salifodinae TaxID=1202768 RepID=A0A1I0M8J4_9EURY|nr:hypothetical protein [Natrinema salifodinae]SEV84448.1 DNA replication factor GINS [Natrinema salifodinae]
MNLDELRSVQSKERQKDSLQNLRPSFYQEVGEYIADLEDERDRVADQADDPFSSPEVGRLTDEIETAKDVVEAIYERRMGKLVKQASLAAAGMPADDEGLTAEEADLFDDLVERIESNKSRVLDVLEGADGAQPADPDPDGSPGPAPGAPGTDAAADDAPPAPPEQPSTATDAAADGSSGVSPADVMGGDGPSVDDADGGADPPAPPEPSGSQAGGPGEEPVPSTAPESGLESESAPNAESGAEETDPDGTATDSAAADVERTTVRITSDIGEILGVDDREYTLTSDDVVTLPEQNAAPLVEREAAERLD